MLFRKRMMPMVIASACSVFVCNAGAADSVIMLGEVPVTAQSNGPLMASNVLTSVDILAGERVHEKNVMNSWELIGQMPGVQLTEFRLGAESGKPSFRAFNGEGYINGIKLLIDGVPSNINNGNMRHFDMISPLDIEYVEVVRGTNDPRYGLHNIGGNINVGTRQGGNYNDMRFTYGSFNTREAQAAFGKEKDGFAQNYFFSKQDSAGYRDHSKSEKYSAGGKWFVTSSDGNLKVGVIARTYNHQAEEAGYLTATELAANRFQSPAKNANDRGNRDMQHLSAHVDWQINPATTLTSKLYFNSMKDDRFVTYTSDNTVAGARQRRTWDEQHYGWVNTLTWRANDKFTLDGGFNVEHQDNEYRRNRYDFAVPTNFSTPAAILNDDSYNLNNFGAYVQAVIKPFDSLKIIPGIRTDKFTGSTKINTSGVTGPLQDYGWINQPKLSVVYSLTPTTSVYGNWGRTFQILTGSRANAYVTASTTPIVAPSINTGKEIGVKFKPVAGTEVRIAAWQQDATDEVANLPSAAITRNLGQTRRKGLDFIVTSQVSERVQAWFSHAVQEAKIVGGYTSSSQSLAGKEVFSTPRFVTNLGADYKLSETLQVGAQVRAQGSYFIDDLNAQGKFGGYVLTDTSMRYTLSKSASIDLQVKNVFDRKYEYVWYDSFFWTTPQPMFSPGAGRAAYVSLNLKL